MKKKNYGSSWTNFVLTQPSHEIAFTFPWNRITIFFCKTIVKFVKKLLNKSYAFRTAMVYTNVIRQKICIKESIFSVLASKASYITLLTRPIYYEWVDNSFWYSTGTNLFSLPIHFMSVRKKTTFTFSRTDQSIFLKGSKKSICWRQNLCFTVFTVNWLLYIKLKNRQVNVFSFHSLLLIHFRR